jgi:DNA-binding Lrp family transcriptional regulator
LDRIDIKILGQLFRGVSSIGREPEVKGVYGRVAKKLRLDEEAVRRRVVRMESAGLIRGWQLLINPNVLGLKQYGVLMTVNPQVRIEEAVRKIRLVQGITYICRPPGDMLRIGILCKNEGIFKKNVDLISELAGTKERMTYAVCYPAAEFEPTRADWQVINAFRPDPLVHYAEVAEKLGLSSRTVRRRLKRLAHGNVVFFRPNIDFSLLDGCSCASLFILYTASGFKGRVDIGIFTKFEDYVLRAGWGNPSHGYFEFVIPNIDIAQEIVDWTRAQQGVKEVRLNFRNHRLNFYDEALDEITAGKVSRIPALQVA